MSEDCKIFRYGEFEGRFDASDYTALERWEDALTKFRERLKASEACTKNSEKFKVMTLAVAGVFDDFFGDGTSNKVLGSTTSLDDAFTAFDALNTFVQEQSQATAGRWQTIASKYKPNRAQRRKGK